MARCLLGHALSRSSRGTAAIGYNIERPRGWTAPGNRNMPQAGARDSKLSRSRTACRATEAHARPVPRFAPGRGGHPGWPHRTLLERGEPAPWRPMQPARPTKSRALYVPLQVEGEQSIVFNDQDACARHFLILSQSVTQPSAPAPSGSITFAAGHARRHVTPPGG